MSLHSLSLSSSGLDPAAAEALAQRTRSRRRRVWALVLVFIAAALAGLGFGAVPIGLETQALIVLDRLGLTSLDASWVREEAVLLSIRLPRVLLAILVGGGLAVCGAALQGLFRNPLADPGLIGVSAGAALGAVATIVFGGLFFAGLPPAVRPYLLPLAAFLGGLVVTVIIQRLARRGGETDIATLLLAGIAINAIAAAAMGFLIYLADDQQLRQVTIWTLGSLAGRPWGDLIPVVPVICLAVVGIFALARPLNALLLGEQEAYHLGVEVESMKRRLVFLVALATGAAVAVSGVIGFVGLVVPHLVRLLLGGDHRLLLPASAVAGASLLLLADLAARHVVLPAELPIGILTSLLGGPFFLWLLLRRRDMTRG
ncbi:MAG: iron chelate uptake ABC transporter family permease subunit [Pseudomonadota bacterium]